MLCKTKKQGLSVGEKFLRNITNNKISFGEEGLFIELGEIRELVQQEWNRRFEKKFGELEAFKDEFGHCHVPRKFVNNPSLGQWCSTMRGYYKKIQNEMITDINLSQDRIDYLEEIGFLWQGVRASKYNKRNKTKDEEVEEVMAATIGTFDEVKIKDNDILLIFGKEATDPYPNNVELYSKTLKENHKAFTETNL